jgi:hypothetical protein
VKERCSSTCDADAKEGKRWAFNTLAQIGGLDDVQLLLHICPALVVVMASFRAS